MADIVADKQHPIILFDGDCNLCSGSVQWIISHDSRAKFKFASLQSKVGQEFIAQYAISAEVDSVLLIMDGKIFSESGAALRIAKQCDGVWKMLWIFIIIPPIIRNYIYRIIAKNRYQWFGKKEVCWMPDASLNARFLG